MVSIMKGRSTTTIIAIVLLAVAAIGIGLAVARLNPPETLVLKPKADGEGIQAYRLVTLEDFDQVAVPDTETSVTENDLTAEYLAEKIEDGEPVFFTQNKLPGQRLDKREVGSDPQGSLSIVSADERLVLVSGSAAGTLGGLLFPGAIVTATANNGEVTSEFAKVIAFGIGGNVGSETQLQEAGGVDSGQDPASEANSGGQRLVLLAVSEGDADQLAGKDVSLTLNPHCKITDEGLFTSVSEALADQCRPAGRAASATATAADDEDAEDAVDETAAADEQ